MPVIRYNLHVRISVGNLTRNFFLINLNFGFVNLFLKESIFSFLEFSRLSGVDSQPDRQTDDGDMWSSSISTY